jgi:hypothetical protein
MLFGVALLLVYVPYLLIGLRRRKNRQRLFGGRNGDVDCRTILPEIGVSFVTCAGEIK